MGGDQPTRHTLYSFTEAVAGTVGLAQRSSLTHRQRAALTGVARNNAEAAHIQGFLDTIDKEMRFKGPGGMVRHLNGLKVAVGKLNGILTLTRVAPVYAPVWETPELNRRTVDEALAVAGANLRRAVSGGDLGAADKYLGMMRKAVGLASDEGRA